MSPAAQCRTGQRTDAHPEAGRATAQRPDAEAAPRDGWLLTSADAESQAPPEIGEGDIGDDAPLRRSSARDWTIQIGAYADSKLARAQLASYAERSMDVLGQAARIVVPFRGVDGQTLFRARFGPFAEREARAVCAALTQRGQTCFAALATS